MNFIRTSLLGLLALPLAAQSTGFSAGGGLILAPSKQLFGSYEKAVHNKVGFDLNGAYDFKLYQTDVDARATLTAASMPGKATAYGLKTSLTLVQLSGDIFLSLGSENVRGLFGFSVNSYSASFSGKENTTDRAAATQHFPFKDCSGLKMGFRVGVDYAITKSFSTEVIFQQTELAGSDLSEQTNLTNSSPFVRAGGISPSWLQFGVRYHF